jgi:hypothetical protein
MGHEAVKSALPVHADAAKPGFPGEDVAEVIAEFAPYPFIGKVLVPPRRMVWVGHFHCSSGLRNASDGTNGEDHARM